MLSKYIQYFLDENNLELGEEFTIVYENGSKVYKDNEAFFFKNTPTYTNDILISKKDENFCPTILLGLLTGLYYVKKKPWQPEMATYIFTSRLTKEGIKVLSIAKHCLIKMTYSFCF